MTNQFTEFGRMEDSFQPCRRYQSLQNTLTMFNNKWECSMPSILRDQNLKISSIIEKKKFITKDSKIENMIETQKLLNEKKKYENDMLAQQEFKDLKQIKQDLSKLKFHLFSPLVEKQMSPKRKQTTQSQIFNQTNDKQLLNTFYISNDLKKSCTKQNYYKRKCIKIDEYVAMRKSIQITQESQDSSSPKKKKITYPQKIVVPSVHIIQQSTTFNNGFFSANRISSSSFNRSKKTLKQKNTQNNNIKEKFNDSMYFSENQDNKNFLSEGKYLIINKSKILVQNN